MDSNGSCYSVITVTDKATGRVLEKIIYNEYDFRGQSVERIARSRGRTPRRISEYARRGLVLGKAPQ